MNSFALEHLDFIHCCLPCAKSSLGSLIYLFCPALGGHYKSPPARPATPDASRRGHHASVPHLLIPFCLFDLPSPSRPSWRTFYPLKRYTRTLSTKSCHLWSREAFVAWVTPFLTWLHIIRYYPITPPVICSPPPHLTPPQKKTALLKVRDGNFYFVVCPHHTWHRCGHGRQWKNSWIMHKLKISTDVKGSTKQTLIKRF